MQVMFCTSNQIGAIAIRAITWSKWSHVALLLGDGTAIEAAWPRVRRVGVDELLAQHSKYEIVEFTGMNDQAVIDAAMSQLGKPYDLTALFGLLLHRDWQQSSKWFCSELVAWAFAAAGHTLFRREDISRITPQHLWMLNYPVV